MKFHPKIEEHFQRRKEHYAEFNCPIPKIINLKASYLWVYYSMGPITDEECDLFFDWKENKLTEEGLLYLAERKI
jgi:hypothetical protein